MEGFDASMAVAAVRFGLPFFVSGSNGEIHSANAAFCELLGYTEFELKKKGWITLSVDDEDLLADKQTLVGLVEGHILMYSVVKSFVAKGGTPVPGHLTVIRHPQDKAELIRCLCWFVPLTNGSKAAMTLLFDYLGKHTTASQAVAEKIEDLAETIRQKKKRTVGQRLWDNLGEWALENPKLAVAMFLLFMALNPYPIIITWVTRMGWLPATPVQIEIKDQKTGEAHPATRHEVKYLIGLNQHKM